MLWYRARIGRGIPASGVDPLGCNVPPGHCAHVRVNTVLPCSSCTRPTSASWGRNSGSSAFLLTALRASSASNLARARTTPDIARRWIAYQSNETGRFEIYVRPFPGPGAAIPISAAGGVYARWARDGSELYYVAPDATMMAAKIRHTAGTLSAGAPIALFRTRRVGGGVNVIGYGQQYDVAPDGRFLINVEPESNLRRITLVMNWKPPAR